MKSTRTNRIALILAFLLPLLTPALHAESFFAAWVQEYLNNVEQSQGAKAIALDSRGNVIVTGFDLNGNNGASTAYTVKYNGADGSIVWTKTLSATNDVQPTAVAIDSNDAVIITGRRNASGDDDFFVMKYNADGSQATGFANPVVYDGTAGGEDIPAKVVIDGANNIIVAGKSVGVSANSDFYVKKYSPTGVALQEERTTTPRFDEATDIAVGPDNSIIAVGLTTVASAEARFHIRKLTPAFGLAFAAKTIDTGGRGGAVAVVVDQVNGDIYATGLFNNTTGEQGFYTIKYAANGDFQWDATVEPTSGDFSGTPTDIAIGPDRNPVVTGYLKDQSGKFYARTIKYQANPPGNTGVVLRDISDSGFIQEETLSRKVAIDAANNIIILGESVNSHGAQASFSNKDVYVAKYDGTTGDILFVGGFNGGFSSSDDKGTDLAIDPFGDIAITSTPIRKRADDIDTGRGEITTIKFSRFIASRDDDLPDNLPGVPDNAKFFSSGAPAIGDDGTAAAKILFASGSAKKGGILVQGSGGGSTVPAVQGGDAPDEAGANDGKFASFSDPVVASNGNYAFTGKLSGVSKKNAGGVWQSIGGSLRRVLQQGNPIPGLPDLTFASASSIAMRNGQLLVLAKLAGSPSTNIALIGINSAGSATLLLQKGVTMVTAGTGEDPSPVKSITVLSPAPASPGDGRWQATNASVVARVGLVSKRTVTVRITSAGDITPVISTGLEAVGLPATPVKSLGLPAISVGPRVTTLVTLTPGDADVSASNDTVLVYNAGATNQPYAREGDAPPVETGLQSLAYAGFSDPVIATVNAAPAIAFRATLKGQGVKKKKNDTALIYGSPLGTFKTAARTGSTAPGAPGEDETTFADVSSFAMPNGTAVGPVFVSKLVGSGTNAKNNQGIFAIDSTSSARRLLRTGQILGDRTVKSFLLLKAVPQAFAAARSFNNANSVAAAITFTNGDSAILRLSIP